MYKCTSKKFRIARESLIAEITERAINLSSLKIKSELQNTIPLEFYDDVFILSPALKNYPFLQVENDEVCLIFVNKDCQDEYIESYKIGEKKLKCEGLDMFTADDLFNICQYLEKLEEKFKIK